MSERDNGSGIAAPAEGVAGLIACPDCDMLHRLRPLAPGEKARCVRCGTVLYRRPRLQPDHLLAVVATALITLVIAHGFPIVDLEVSGNLSSTTLLGSAVTLWREGRQPVAVLVVATALLAPLIDLLAVGALLAGRRGRLAGRLARVVHALRPWGMTEVFMLGVLVSLVKLSHMARIIPGVSLWAFSILTILLAVIAAFDMRSLWLSSSEARRP